MPPPRIPVAAPTRLGGAESASIRAAIDRVISGSSWILGPEVAAFESEFGAYSGVEHVVGVASGTDALTLALLGFDLPPRSTVLVPENDGGFAGAAARLAGLVPRVYDVEDGWTAGIAQLDAAWSADVTAVVVTHLHGRGAPLGAIDAWRRAKGLRLLEDWAQAVGAELDGARLRPVGDAAAYSFYPTKSLGGIGDGGAVATGDEDVARRARRLAQYGWGARFDMSLPGGRNSRLDALQAAILRARLPYVETRTARRRALLERYAVAERPGLAFPDLPSETIVHHAVVLAAARDDLAAHLDAAGIETAVHYPTLVSEMAGIAAESGPTPNADRQRRMKLSLPVDGLTDDEASRVVAALLEWPSDGH